jgi:hypothetical protein
MPSSATIANGVPCCGILKSLTSILPITASAINAVLYSSTKVIFFDKTLKKQPLLKFSNFL